MKIQRKLIKKEIAEELIRVQEDYIKLLEKSLALSNSFLYSHNFSYPEEHIELAKNIRNKIKSLISKEEFK